MRCTYWVVVELYLYRCTFVFLVIETDVTSGSCVNIISSVSLLHVANPFLLQIAAVDEPKVRQGLVVVLAFLRLQGLDHIALLACIL